MVQLADDAPDDIPSYTWNAQVSFDDMGDLTPDDIELMGEDLASDPEAVLSAALGGVAADAAPDDPEAAAAIAGVDTGLLADDPQEIGAALFDAGLTVDDVADALDADTLDAVRAAWIEAAGDIGPDTIMELLADGDVDTVQALQELAPETDEVLSSLASAGFDDSQAFEAATLAEVLDQQLYFDETDGRWYMQ